MDQIIAPCCCFRMLEKCLGCGDTDVGRLQPREKGDDGGAIPWPRRITIFPSVPSLSTAVVAYPILLSEQILRDKR